MTMTGDRPKSATIPLQKLLPVTAPGKIVTRQDHSPSAPASEPDSTARPGWERRYAFWLHVADAAVLLVAVGLSVGLQTDAPGSSGSVTGTLGAILGLTAMWCCLLSVSGGYESQLLARGPEEYRRVLSAAWQFAAVLAVGSYIIRVPVSRGFLLVTVTTGALGVVAVHGIARGHITHLQSRGKALHRVLVVGPAFAAAETIRALNAESGFAIVGVCSAGFADDGMLQDEKERVVGLGDVRAHLARCRADTVAVVGCAQLPEGFLRDLSWDLEGTNIDLMVSPSFTDVAGPRIHIRPLARLSMLYVEQPQLRGAAWFVKSTLDRLVAFVLLLVLSPVLLAIAVLVKVTSPGGVIFRQRRSGLAGEYFGIWKFRTMRAGLDRFQGYDLARELGEVGEKTVSDPRITRLGAVLRRTSLDELPQLVNVLLGQMSLVGPRPLRRHEIESFAGHELRRHTVKPGMTGLWQVSGRADLSWQERTRLDLYYVENWTPLLDVAIILRTLGVVLRRTGAY